MQTAGHQAYVPGTENAPVASRMSGCGIIPLSQSIRRWTPSAALDRDTWSPPHSPSANGPDPLVGVAGAGVGTARLGIGVGASPVPGDALPHAANPSTSRLT